MRPLGKAPSLVAALVASLAPLAGAQDWGGEGRAGKTIIMDEAETLRREMAHRRSMRKNRKIANPQVVTEDVELYISIPAFEDDTRRYMALRGGSKARLESAGNEAELVAILVKQLQANQQLSRLVIADHGSRGKTQSLVFRSTLAVLREKKIHMVFDPDAEILFLTCLTGAGATGADFVKAAAETLLWSAGGQVRAPIDNYRSAWGVFENQFDSPFFSTWRTARVERAQAPGQAGARISQPEDLDPGARKKSLERELASLEAALGPGTPRGDFIREKLASARKFLAGSPPSLDDIMAAEEQLDTAEEALEGSRKADARSDGTPAVKPVGQPPLSTAEKRAHNEQMLKKPFGPQPGDHTYGPQGQKLEH